MIFEESAEGWSAFPADDFGCGSLGDTLEETREDFRSVLTVYLAETVRFGDPLPLPKATSVDFAEFDPNHTQKHYVVEWLTIEAPISEQVDIAA